MGMKRIGKMGLLRDSKGFYMRNVDGLREKRQGRSEKEMGEGKQQIREHLR